MDRSIRWELQSKRFGYTAQPPHWFTDPPHGSGLEGTTRRGGRIGRDCGVADSLGARRSGRAARDERQRLAAPGGRRADADAHANAAFGRRGRAERGADDGCRAAVGCRACAARSRRRPPKAPPQPRARRAKRLRLPPSGRSRSERPLRPHRLRLPRSRRRSRRRRPRRRATGPFSSAASARKPMRGGSHSASARSATRPRSPA